MIFEAVTSMLAGQVILAMRVPGLLVKGYRYPSNSHYPGTLGPNTRRVLSAIRTGDEYVGRTGTTGDASTRVSVKRVLVHH